MSQFTTLTEAKTLAKEIGQIGNGVLPYVASLADEPVSPELGDPVSGIYIPSYLGPFATPEGKDGKKFYHFRFNNGASGFNAGLIYELKARCPTSWQTNLALEVNASAKATR